MADSTTERLMDVVLLLLNSSSPLTVNQIRERVPGYQQDDPDSFKRMFERDKKAMREANIPIETVEFDSVNGETQAYVLNKKDWLLPDLNLSERERMLITLAATGWQNHHMAQVAREAARQMGGLTTQANTGGQLRLGFDQRNFPEVLEAIRLNKSLVMDYASKTSGKTSTRNVDPWQLVCRNGAWYLIGYDNDKLDMRVFKISRIVGNVALSETNIVNKMPKDFDVEASLDYWTRLVSDPISVTLRVIPGSCQHLSVVAKNVSYQDTYDEMLIETADIYGITRDIASRCHEVLSITPHVVADRVREIVFQASEVNG